jgi:hypothetical protein
VLRQRRGQDVQEERGNYHLPLVFLSHNTIQSPTSKKKSGLSNFRMHTEIQGSGTLHAFSPNVKDTVASPSINASIPSYPSNTISYPEIALMTAWTGFFPTGNAQPFSPVADPHVKLKLVAEEKYSTTEKGGGKSLLGG